MDLPESTHGVNLRKWTRQAGSEPSVRIGVVLARDGFEGVRLRLTGRPYTLRAVTPAEDVGAAAKFVLPDSAVLDVRCDAGLLHPRVSHVPLGPMQSLRIQPSGDARTEPAPGVMVEGVIAGRGFHWQKRIDVTLGGAVEILPGPKYLVLVNELPLEDYLVGVITAEMSGECPSDLLKAQCVVARSWLLALTEPKHETEPFDRCNDDCCQRYQGIAGLGAAARGAVAETRGLVLLGPDERVLDANYSKSCGGISESPLAVWGMPKSGISCVVDAPPDAAERRFFPIRDENLDEYLDGAWLNDTRVYCSPNCVPAEALRKYLGRVDEVDDYFRWTASYSREELESLLREKLFDLRELVELVDLRITNRGASGRVTGLEIAWQTRAGRCVRTALDTEYLIREVLHRKFLYSSAFALRMSRDGTGRLSTITLRGAGWGHGVGLCQIGALGMALAGIDFQAICRHYYPEARLDVVYR